MKDNIKIVFVLVVVVLLAGAFFINWGRRDSDSITEPDVVVSPATQINTVVIQEEAESTTEAMKDSAEPVPTPRTGMEASDPGSVNLISGKVQFVEAFAFW